MAPGCENKHNTETFKVAIAPGAMTRTITVMYASPAFLSKLKQSKSLERTGLKTATPCKRHNGLLLFNGEMFDFPIEGVHEAERANLHPVRALLS